VAWATETGEEHLPRFRHNQRSLRGAVLSINLQYGVRAARVVQPRVDRVTLYTASRSWRQGRCTLDSVTAGVRAALMGTPGAVQPRVIGMSKISTSNFA